MIKAFVPTPVGVILIQEDGRQLVSLRILAVGEGVPESIGPPAAGTLAGEAARQLTTYFETGPLQFDLPLRAAASPRGEALRRAIAAIPVGETLSYGAVARMAGSAPRAVGQACARNPFPIVIPCHRVVGSGGAIGHYSGASGVVTKLWLLNHERGGVPR